MKSLKSSRQLKRPKLPLLVRRVTGYSMMPVLPPGTVIYGVKWLRRNRLKPGDVVVFSHDNREKIKRIARIDGRKMYVLGDYSAGSSDSRDFGWLSTHDVLAKVVWPHVPKQGKST